MKKALTAALAFGTALLCLAGCGNKFEGTWECVKMKEDDDTLKAKDFKDELGYDTDEYMVFELDGDGTGTLTFMDGEYETDLEWEADDDEITFELEDEFLDGSDELTGEIKDDQFIIEIEKDDLKMYFEKSDDKDDDDDDDDDDDKGSRRSKSKLKSANSSAKLVFTTVECTVADMLADGENMTDVRSLGYPKKISELDTSNPIENAVYQAMKDNGDDSGYVYWEIDNDYRITFAQFGEETDGVIGQYPEPETDPSNDHDMGYKF